MTWSVVFHPEFEPEFDAFAEAVQDDLLAHAHAHARALEARGPIMGRPYVDALKGSAFPNMKELRFGAADGVWRLAFVFDPQRKAVLLVAGDKRGKDQKRFYRDLIRVADRRYAGHLADLAKGAGIAKAGPARRKR